MTIAETSKTSDFLFAIILVYIVILQNPCIMNYFPKFFNSGIQKNV